MDSSDNALGENEPTPEASPSELNNFVNSHENTSDLKESTEIDYSKIQDIEFGSKVLLFFDYFTNLKEFFQLSTSEYFDRCLAALYPYFCITISLSALFNHLKSFVYTRRLWFPDSLTSFGDTANAARRGSDDTIHVNLDIPNEENEVSLNFDKDTETVFDVSGSSSYFKGIQLRHQSKWYRTLCSMTQFPDLYGPIWINITASCSLFFSSCLSRKLHSLNSLLTLSCFYELVFLSLTCSFIMAVCVFLCNYFFTKELKFRNFVGFLCVSGYTQIPLAILCKICIFISLLMFFHPLHFILVILKVFTYFYLFISTSFTLSIALPSLDSRKRNFLYKLSAILSSYVTQSVFLTLIQKYIH